MKKLIQTIGIDFLIEAELLLCKDSQVKPFFIDGALRYLVRWVRFLKMGINQLFALLFRWTFLAGALLMAIWILDKFGLVTMTSSNFGLLMNIAIFIPIFSLVFGLPSTFVTMGIPQEIPMALAVQLNSVGGIRDQSEIEAIQKVIDVYEKRVRARLSAMKWMVKLAWLSAIYFLVKILDSIILGSSQFPDLSRLMTISVLIALGGYVLVWGYEAAVDRLFQTVEIALNVNSRKNFKEFNNYHL